MLAGAKERLSHYSLDPIDELTIINPASSEHEKIEECLIDSSLCHNRSLFTQSNAFLKSIKHAMVSSLINILFSIIEVIQGENVVLAIPIWSKTILLIT